MCATKEKFQMFSFRLNRSPWVRKTLSLRHPVYLQNSTCRVPAFCKMYRRILVYKCLSSIIKTIHSEIQRNLTSTLITEKAWNDLLSLEKLQLLKCNIPFKITELKVWVWSAFQSMFKQVKINRWPARSRLLSSQFRCTQFIQFTVTEILLSNTKANHHNAFEF